MPVHPTADVDETAKIPNSASIWHHAQIREGAKIGEDVVVGRGAYIGAGVTVGRGSKVQNYALVYEPARLGEGVFIGPAAVLTNDRIPRSVRSDLRPKHAADWTAVGVDVMEGASIGAGAVCVAPLTIGRWAMVGAGAVVTHNVRDYELVVGNPARRLGWVGPSGLRLVPLAGSPSTWRCPETGALFREDPHGLLYSLP